VVPTGCQNKGTCLSWFIRYIYRNLKNQELSKLTYYIGAKYWM
jgi:hypothetical protein